MVTKPTTAGWRRRRGGIPLGRRVPASRETSERIEELVNALEAHREGPSFQQLGVRKLIEGLLEAEVSERLGRGYDVAYLFSDGIAERLHGGQRREAVLCACVPPGSASDWAPAGSDGPARNARMAGKRGCVHGLLVEKPLVSVLGCVAAADHSWTILESLRPQ